MPLAKLKPSPRLWIPDEVIADLPSRLHTPYLQLAAEEVLRDANRLTRLDPLAEGEAETYLAGGRTMQSRLDCLSCAWVLSRKATYRTAALKHLAGLLKWNHISCEARANTPASREMPFCLSYGEQSASVGLMYDLFRPDMTSQEQRVFFEVVDRFHMKQATRCLSSPPWWANKAWSNWNGVCCGGMGIMALALHDDRPDARPLIPFVEKSLGQYFSSYITNGGGCPEGTGYWNYGMNYAMRYVLSWEHATGRKHPALKIKELGQSLMFPIDFTGISFGDNDGWGPTGFFFLLAQRLGHDHAACRAAAYLPQVTGTKQKPRMAQAGTMRLRARTNDPRSASGDLLFAADAIPTDKQMAKLKAAHARKKVPVARVYKGMDWAALADDEAFPTLRMSVRGGSAEIQGHGMVDLLSFRCRVNGELMITDQQEAGYLVPTFGKRGTDLYTRAPESKSTLFVEGLGCAKDAVCDKTEVVTGKGLSGIRIDATHNYLHQMPAKFIGRLFLFVDNRYWLVIDHALGKTSASEMGIESRFHTYAEYRRGKNHVGLTSGKEKMQMTFAAMQEGVLQESRGMPATATCERTTIFRWMGKQRVVDNLHVVGLNPGPRKLGLSVQQEKRGVYVIEVTEPGRTRARKIRLSGDLRLRGGKS